MYYSKYSGASAGARSLQTEARGHACFHVGVVQRPTVAAATHSEPWASDVGVAQRGKTTILAPLVFRVGYSLGNLSVAAELWLIVREFLKEYELTKFEHCKKQDIEEKVLMNSLLFACVAVSLILWLA